jgi:hypothetical protein
MKKPLKKILQENMRRFKTKNLNEQKGFLQTARPNSDSGWEKIFNNFSAFMSDGNQRSNQIFGWWLETYASMGEQLSFYAQQIKSGHQPEEFKQDIAKIMSATAECIKKFQNVGSDIYKQFVEEDNEYIIDSIKDDLIGELNDLLFKPNKYNLYQIGEQLQDIADDYVFRSETLLNLSWDFAHDSYNPTDTNINKYSQN